jgi:hypothetical protein
MYPIVDIIKEQDKTIVVIVPNPRKSIKMGFTFMAAGFLFMSISFFTSFLQNSDSLFNRLITLALSIVFLFLARNYAKSVLEREKIVVGKDYIEISKRFLFYTSQKTYLKEKINSVDFNSEEEKSGLDKDSFEEITGIKFYKNANNYILKKGVIGFNYDGKEIRFGKDLDPDTAIKVTNKVFR